MPLSQRLYSLLCLAALVVPLINCGSAHDSDEHYIFVAANVQVPYWQAAAAGFSKAGEQMKVQSSFVGPNTYDPKAEREALQEAVQKKPTGIFLTVTRPSFSKNAYPQPPPSTPPHK